MRSPASTPAPSREDQVALFVLSFITEPQMHLPSKPTSRDRDKSHPSLQDLLIHLSSLVAHPTAVSRPCLLKGCLDGILDFLQLGLRINVAITILDSSNTHRHMHLSHTWSSLLPPEVVWTLCLLRLLQPLRHGTALPWSMLYLKPSWHLDFIMLLLLYYYTNINIYI